MFRDGFTYDLAKASLDAGLFCPEEVKTVQSSKDEADINVLVKRFGVTGQMPMNVRVPLYGDFLDAFDFQSAQNAIVLARESFQAMPAEVRDRFGNDPQRFLEFCSDEANLEEMRKLGLAVPKAETSPSSDVSSSGSSS